MVEDLPTVELVLNCIEAIAEWQTERRNCVHALVCAGRDLMAP
jgi:hypothetical protein